MSFARKIGANSLAYGYSQIVTVLSQLALIPMYLAHWGNQGYCEWIVLTGIPQALVFCELGITSALTTKLCIEAGRNDWLSARDTLQTSKFFSLAVGFFLIGLTLLGCLFIDWTSVLKLTTLQNQEAVLILILMSVWTASNIQWGYLDGKMKASNKTALSAFLIANGRLLDIAVCCLILAFNGNQLTAAFGFCFSGLLARSFHSFIASIQAAEPLRQKGYFRFDELWRALNPAFGYLGISTFQVLNLQLSVQILNRISTSETVVAFSIARTLARCFYQFGFVLNNATRPEISRLIAVERKTDALRNLMLVYIPCLFIGLIGFILFVFFGPSFLLIISRSHVTLDSFNIFLIGLHSFFGLIWYVPASYLMATNSHFQMSVRYCIATLFALSVCYFNVYETNPFLLPSLCLAFPEFICCLYIFSFRKRVFLN